MTYAAYPIKKSSVRGEKFWNHERFFTDANGRQKVERWTNERSSFNFTEHDIASDPITSNYYPITTGSFYSICNVLFITDVT